MRAVNIVVSGLEAIRAIEEYPLASVVRVSVGRVDASGEFLVPQTFSEYLIENADYLELTSEQPVEWSPDKPAGTYRNEDIWHFVDKHRNAGA